MKREAESNVSGGGGPTSPHKRYRQGDDELRLLIPSKVRITFFTIIYVCLFQNNNLLFYKNKTKKNVRGSVKLIF